MREDLNAFGNELNYYVVACKIPPLSLSNMIANLDRLDNTAYVLGQIPLMTLQTKGRM